MKWLSAFGRLLHCDTLKRGFAPHRCRLDRLGLGDHCCGQRLIRRHRGCLRPLRLSHDDLHMRSAPDRTSLACGGQSLLGRPLLALADDLSTPRMRGQQVVDVSGHVAAPRLESFVAQAWRRGRVAAFGWAQRMRWICRVWVRNPAFRDRQATCVSCPGSPGGTRRRCAEWRHSSTRRSSSVPGPTVCGRSLLTKSPQNPAPRATLKLSHHHHH
jgi:hypothetical protein